MKTRIARYIQKIKEKRIAKRSLFLMFAWPSMLKSIEGHSNFDYCRNRLYSYNLIGKNAALALNAAHEILEQSNYSFRIEQLKENCLEIHIKRKTQGFFRIDGVFVYKPETKNWFHIIEIYPEWVRIQDRKHKTLELFLSDFPEKGYEDDFIFEIQKTLRKFVKDADERERLFKSFLNDSIVQKRIENHTPYFFNSVEPVVTYYLRNMLNLSTKDLLNI